MYVVYIIKINWLNQNKEIMNPWQTILEIRNHETITAIQFTVKTTSNNTHQLMTGSWINTASQTDIEEYFRENKSVRSYGCQDWWSNNKQSQLWICMATEYGGHTISSACSSSSCVKLGHGPDISSCSFKL